LRASARRAERIEVRKMAGTEAESH
jgi:hypothetical protein